MILFDADLKSRLAMGDLVLAPIDDPEIQIQPASIDLRLGDSFVVYRQPLVPFLDARDPESVERQVERIRVLEGEGFVS